MNFIRSYKLFESNEEDYYQVFNSQETDWSKINYETFNQSDVRKIGDLIFPLDCEFEVYDKPGTTTKNYMIRIKYETMFIEIMALPDEWFLVRLVDTREFPRQKSYYKCDQIEGLLHCLKKILYIH